MGELTRPFIHSTDKVAAKNTSIIMKILIVGSGGREHALAWKVKQSAKVEKVFVAPGNPGTALESLVENIDIAVDDISGLLAFAQAEQIDLTIIGPEIPLVLGIVDRFQEAGLKCLAPPLKLHNWRVPSLIAKTL
jgi:Phosphoribosylamine-glycine ligase